MIRWITLFIFGSIVSAERKSIQYPKIPIKSVAVSSTYSSAVSDFAIDGKIDTGKFHSHCSPNKEWIRLHLRNNACIEAVRVYQSHLNSNKDRMDGAQISVVNSITGEKEKCGELHTTDILTVEGQTYTIPCDMKCGDAIELSVHKNGGCVHVKEVETFGYLSIKIDTPKLPIKSVAVSSTYSSSVSDFAIDGKIDTGLFHSHCSPNKEWIRLYLSDNACIQAVRVYQSHLNEYKDRMDGAQISVVNSITGEKEKCGELHTTDILTVEAQTYIIPCDMKCGDAIELSVHKNGGCVHVKEVETFGYLSIKIDTPKLPIKSVAVSSTYSSSVSDFAIDGKIDTGLFHSHCSPNKEWIRLYLSDNACIQAVRVYQSHLNEYKDRMDGAQISVVNSITGEKEQCGKLHTTDILTVEGQTYTIPCDMKCGDAIELSVHKSGGCVHVKEIEVYGRADYTNVEFQLIDEDGGRVAPQTGWGLLLYKGGTVCDDSFDDMAAHAICRRMGYSDYIRWINGVGWAVQSQFEIRLDDVKCENKKWEECSFLESNGDCAHIEDVMLFCKPRQQGEIIQTTSTTPPSAAV